MSAILMDGKALAAEIKHRLRDEVSAYTHATGHAPGLAVVLVGENPASKAYVASKEKALASVGMKSFHHDLPGDVSEGRLRDVLVELSEDGAVDGILVQLPLPGHLGEQDVLSLIPPEKDADGFHPLCLGRLMQNRPITVPCTPLGVMHLLEKYGISPAGKHAVVIGRSLIVGKPMATLLTHAHATVTLAHSRTPDLPGLCQMADIVVAAVGVPRLVKADWLNKIAPPVVVDVGINRVDGKLVGDVDFDNAREAASFITPVPGGVGPLTVACLLENTLALAKARRPQGGP